MFWNSTYMLLNILMEAFLQNIDAKDIFNYWNKNITYW